LFESVDIELKCLNHFCIVKFSTEFEQNAHLLELSYDDFRNRNPQQ
jgi:hypothetical protein